VRLGAETDEAERRFAEELAVAVETVRCPWVCPGK